MAGILKIPRFLEFPTRCLAIHLVTALVGLKRGTGVLDVVWGGSPVYFGASSGKEKWGTPLCRHCMRTVATLQRLDYPNQRDVFILVPSATVMYTVQA